MGNISYFKTEPIYKPEIIYKDGWNTILLKHNLKNNTYLTYDFHDKLIEVPFVVDDKSANKITHLFASINLIFYLTDDNILYNFNTDTNQIMKIGEDYYFNYIDYNNSLFVFIKKLNNVVVEYCNNFYIHKVNEFDIIDLKYNIHYN